MQRFVHLENLKHLRQLLKRTSNEAERQRIVQLIAEEETRVIQDEASEQIPRGRAK